MQQSDNYTPTISLRSDSPEHWAEIVLLFGQDLKENPQTFIEEAAIDLLEMREGESIASILKTAKSILEGVCQAKADS